jgi:hypothetical protein
LKNFLWQLKVRVEPARGRLAKISLSEGGGKRGERNEVKMKPAVSPEIYDTSNSRTAPSCRSSARQTAHTGGDQPAQFPTAPVAGTGCAGDYNL